MGIYEIHQVGGMIFMAPLTIAFIINIVIVVRILIGRARDKAASPFLVKAVKHIGTWALAWGMLSTVIGLFFALGALEESQEIVPFNVIMGGLKVGLITAEYGLIIFVLSLLAFIVLKGTNKATA